VLEDMLQNTKKILNLGLLNDTSKRICSDAPDAKVTCRFTLATHICTKKVCLGSTEKVAFIMFGNEKKVGFLLHQEGCLFNVWLRKESRLSTVWLH
jgi:hypothetical protein